MTNVSGILRCEKPTNTGPGMTITPSENASRAQQQGVIPPRLFVAAPVRFVLHPFRKSAVAESREKEGPTPQLALQRWVKNNSHLALSLAISK
jgi:hypothetical protein